MTDRGEGEVWVQLGEITETVVFVVLKYHSVCEEENTGKDFCIEFIGTVKNSSFFQQI